MKKQIAIVTVAITLTAVLIVPTIMAFAVKNGNSVQYSSHRGLNFITNKSVTASNQPITVGNGVIRVCKSISKVSDDAVLNNSSTSMNEKPATNLDGPEWRVPGKITEGVIEGVPKGKIIKGTPENPEQVILYVKTADGKLHPLKATIRVL